MNNADKIRLERVAEQLEVEATTWADGFAGRNPDGSLRWDSKEYEFAHVRYVKLMSHAEFIRDLAAGNMRSFDPCI